MRHECILMLFCGHSDSYRVEVMTAELSKNVIKAYHFNKALKGLL